MICWVAIGDVIQNFQLSPERRKECSKMHKHKDWLQNDRRLPIFKEINTTNTTHTIYWWDRWEKFFDDNRDDIVWCALTFVRVLGGNDVTISIWDRAKAFAVVVVEVTVFLRESSGYDSFISNKEVIPVLLRCICYLKWPLSSISSGMRLKFLKLYNCTVPSKIYANSEGLPFQIFGLPEINSLKSELFGVVEDTWWKRMHTRNKGEVHCMCSVLESTNFKKFNLYCPGTGLSYQMDQIFLI